MSLSHKAYVFDHAKFSDELKLLLATSIRTGDAAALQHFISSHLPLLTDPYEGGPLTEEWEAHLEFGSPEEYADVALTKYYDVRADIGLGQQWEEISDWLRLHTGGVSDPTLGSVIGTPEALFDPGKMGSYFQTADDVSDNMRLVERLAVEHPTKVDLTGPVITLFRHALQARKGLYITF